MNGKHVPITFLSLFLYINVFYVNSIILRSISFHVVKTRFVTSQIENSTWKQVDYESSEILSNSLIVCKILAMNEGAVKFMSFLALKGM
jgi:hypothetical protein